MRETARDRMGAMDLNDFEKNVIAAGFDGYRNNGMVVVLGRNVPVDYLGNRLEARKALDLAPSAQNQIRLAKALLARGETQESLFRFTPFPFLESTLTNVRKGLIC
mgnify:CR=1 FL=1